MRWNRKFTGAVMLCALCLPILSVQGELVYMQKNIEGKESTQENRNTYRAEVLVEMQPVYAGKSQGWITSRVDNVPRQDEQEAKAASTATGEDSRAVGADAQAELKNLYAMSAVLLDGDSGRVLYEKNGYEKRPMASTTKVMTCILALENCSGGEIVQVSANAASQPDVQLNIREGEEYYLEDLLYSLMLKSHNDTAVAIAEHVGGSMEGFARMMNDKAKELGCNATYFITPNGLDAKDSHGEHSTTARDLAIIMRYAITNETFLKITQTKDYSFSEIHGKRQCQVNNANAFLSMMDGALSGKTGFTANAGYCYVGALRREDRTFIVALLGCGWPNHKDYKWSDTRKLMEYGLMNYQYRNVYTAVTPSAISVLNGIPETGNMSDKAYVPLRVEDEDAGGELQVLLKDGEQVHVDTDIREELQAPVKKGQKVGAVTYSLEGKPLYQFPIVAEKGCEKLDFSWCLDQVCEEYFH